MMKRFFARYLICIPIMVESVLSVPTLQWEHSQVVLESNISRTVAGLESGVPLPVDDPTVSYWLGEPRANPLAKAGSQGPLPAQADICIIGSGITGVSAAYHLSRLQGSAEKPLRAVILEARDFCSGATGRNGGHLTANIFHDFVLRQNLYGVKEAIKTFELEKHTVASVLSILSEHDLGDKVDLVSSDHNTVFITKEEEEIVRADFEAAIAAGVNLDVLKWRTAEDMKKTYGVPYPAATFKGNNLYPLKLVTELYKLAQKTSPSFKLDLHTHTPVTSISQAEPGQTGKKWALHTPRGEINCNYIIHATNAYVNHLVPRSEIVVTPTRGQIIALRAGANETRISKSSWGANEGFEYWFPRPVDNDENPLVIIGGGREAAPEFEVGVVDDSIINKDVSKALKDFLPSLFTGAQEGEEIYAKGREPEQEWTGIMGFTKSGDPFVGPLNGHDGQYVAAGFSGHGMPRGFACAEVVAKMVYSALTGSSFTLPDWMPNHYLTTS